MEFSNFKAYLHNRNAKWQSYVQNKFGRRAGEIALRFIDTNFKMQGWQGASFEAWKPNRRGGTILIKTARLRRSNYFTPAGSSVRIYNNTPYAWVHNNGFHGTVNVKSFERRALQARKGATGRVLKSGRQQVQTVHSLSGKTTVKAHTRTMNIPQRKFFPNSYNDSPVLTKELQTEIFNSIKQIFN